ncbi:hypothetical protein CEXT_739731 [Caerostris extrusa]|uniref:Uncharacterized protein n=1 Tax=Caerostris extrusa TaxID=172846 RepID=A0AAV4U8H8_CAEEX|nr:hypothetical protein CEXT_739731 [Caerostris extrusa]
MRESPEGSQPGNFIIKTKCYNRSHLLSSLLFICIKILYYLENFELTKLRFEIQECTLLAKRGRNNKVKKETFSVRSPADVFPIRYAARQLPVAICKDHLQVPNSRSINVAILYRGSI